MEAFKTGDMITTTTRGPKEEWRVVDVTENLVALKARSSAANLIWYEKAYVKNQIVQGAWEMK